MKKITFVVMGIIISFLLSTWSFAQQGMKWRGNGGWGPGAKYSRMYDPKTVETISGEVVKVDRIVPMKGMSYGVHLIVQTDKEKVAVHLGPSWYIENQDVKIEAGDKLVITGSRIAFGGKPAIIAAEIKKGEEVLKLRNESGLPLWAGWRNR